MEVLVIIIALACAVVFLAVLTLSKHFGWDGPVDGANETTSENKPHPVAPAKPSPQENSPNESP